MSNLRKLLIDQARTYLGVPWRHQGRTRSGVDCIGLPVCVAKDMGWHTKDYRHYGLKPDWRFLLRLMKENLYATKVGGLGDCVLWSVHGLPHVGILGDLGDPFSVIHAWQDKGKVVEHRFTEELEVLKVQGFYTFKPIRRAEWPASV